MLNREMRPVSVITFASGVDSYGQPRTVVSSTKTVDMVVKIYAQSNVQAPIFNEVEIIGITKDFTISEENQIQFDSKKYNVLHTIPSGKYLQVLMKKVL